METIVILGGGPQSKYMIEVARKMNLKVLILDMDDQCAARSTADGFIHASVYDVKEAVDAVVTHHNSVGKISGVICSGVDAPVTAAHISAKLGIPGQDIESAEIAVNKIRLKKRFVEANIRTPRFRQVRSGAEIAQILEKEPGRYVIKPADNRGAKGVLVISDPADADVLFARSLAHSPSSVVLLEWFAYGNLRADLMQAFASLGLGREVDVLGVIEK